MPRKNGNGQPASGISLADLCGTSQDYRHASDLSKPLDLPILPLD